MAQQLNAIGYHVVVITIDHLQVFGARRCDLTLLQQLPVGLTVVRTGYRHRKLTSRLVQTGFSFHPDAILSGWEAAFKKAMPALVLQYQPAAVVVTMPPFSVGKLGLWMKHKFGVPFIADLRDAWSNWVYVPFASRLHYQAIRRQERQLLSGANAVLVTSRQTLADFKKLYPQLSPHQLHYLPNGFDAYNGGLTPQIQVAAGPIKIGYVGSFYYNPVSQKLLQLPWYRKKMHQWLQYVPHREDWLYRTPYFFFKTLHHLFQLHPELKLQVKVVFAGERAAWLDAMVERFGLGDVVQHSGRVSREESLALQLSCDYLLLTSSKVVGGLDYSIAGKTFEYFSMLKPIIGFVCPGAQRQLLEQSRLAVLADPDDEASCYALMRSLLEQGVCMSPDYTYLDTFKTSNLAGVLQKVVAGVVNPNASAPADATHQPDAIA